MARRSRRSFLKASSAALVGASLRGFPVLRASGPPRVAIVGGGLAGVSCAWLLDGAADAVLFESRAELGGHAHTIPVDVGGQEIQVDVGAQFFARGPHPTYVELLSLLGLTHPGPPAGDTVIEAEMTMSVTEAGRPSPRFLSPSRTRLWAVLPPWNRSALWAFFVFALAAKRFSANGSWDVTVADWLARLPVRAEEREKLLLPLLSAMVGCTVDEARGLSARGAVLFVGKALPEKLLDPFQYGNSRIGLGGNVQHLAQSAGNLTTHLGSPVTSVEPRMEGGYRVQNLAGASEDVDAVVFATPPFVTRPLLNELPSLAGAAGVLDDFAYFDAEISIHRDPIYMPESPRHWSAYNAHLDGGRCEASVWYGALRPVEPGGTPLMLFKSWATARTTAPAEEILRRAFRHPLVSPAFLNAQEQLAAWQGVDGVWFAGSYTREVDSQETALVSAMDVVRQIAPFAPNLLALESALQEPVE